MSRIVRAALAAVALAAPVMVEAQAKPVVAVLYFDNNSVGKDHADYDGVGKGLAEIFVNDLAQNPNVRVVERERIQALMTEQNLVKAGTIDPQTAIRLGRILGAQYMITGAFMSDGRGNVVLTGRTVNVETSAIGNPTRINAKGDDVLGMIAQLSEKMSAEMKLPALRVGDASGIGATPAGQPAAAPAHQAQVVEAKPAEAKAADAKPAKHVAQAKASRKMDMKTAMLYSKALEEEDAGNKSKAVELYRRVDVVFPDYAPVQQKIKKLSA
jgi:TolB-like protein